MTQTDVSTLRLHVRRDVGEGPVFVLLHGINSDGTDWDNVIDRIGPHFRCIAPDLLGFGNSPKPLDIDYTADEHALVLKNTLDDLGVRERFVLVGYSQGGDVAIRYASTYPDTLRRLFLLSAPFYLPAEALERKGFGKTAFQSVLFRGLWNSIAVQKKKDTAVYDLMTGRLEDFARAFIRTDDVSMHWDIMAKNLTNTIAAATFVDDLPKLTMPTTFALGVRDPIVKPDQTPSLKLLKPDIEIRRIVGLSADHFLLVNIPERIAEEIMRDEIEELGVHFHDGTGPGIVLVGGIERGSESLEPMASALALENDVTIIDLLGFGRSPVPLSSHYTIDDHAAAMVATIEKLYGAAPVRIVGHGFGALVALACAALRPQAFTDVVAFSPTMLEPGSSVSEATKDPVIAALVAERESLAFLARDPRAQRVNSERLEQETVPPVRSYDAILATDAAELLDRVHIPVRFVVPDGDAQSPRDFLRLEAEEHDYFELVEPQGDRQFPIERPADGLSVIGGITQAQLYAASVAKPAPPARRTTLNSVLGGLNSQLVRRGVLFLMGALPLLLLPSIPPRLVTVGFAVWLLLEALQTISGAFGLKRSGKSWLPWMLIGVVSILFAVLITARDAFAFTVVGLVIGVGAAIRGVTDLVVAWKVKEIPARRWALLFTGLFAIAISVLVFVAPEFGGRLLRYTLGGYLAVSGITNLLFAWGVHRSTRKRILHFLHEHPVPKST